MGEEGQGRGGKQGDEAECEWVKSTWVGCPGWIRSWSWQSWRPRRRRRGRGRASPGTCGHGEWRFLRARGLVRRHRRRRRRRGSGQWWRLEDLLHPIPFWLSSTSGLRVLDAGAAAAAGVGGGGDGEVPYRVAQLPASESSWGGREGKARGWVWDWTEGSFEWRHSLRYCTLLMVCFLAMAVFRCFKLPKNFTGFPVTSNL
jgi:hypothetical protein